MPKPDVSIRGDNHGIHGPGINRLINKNEDRHGNVGAIGSARSNGKDAPQEW